MADLKIKEPASFSKFVEFIESLNVSSANPLWFRGCGASSHSLVPSIYRHRKKNLIGDIAKLEAETMVRFRQKSIPFTDRVFQDEWEMLFFMQHYRIPTRLLDWSENPFVAFYFAVMSAKFEEQPNGSLRFLNDAALWVLDPVKWNQKALSHQSFDGGILTTSNVELAPYKPSKTFDGMLNAPVAIYGAHNSPRIVAQRGTFMLFGKVVHGMEVEYEAANFPKDCLIKIVLKRDLLPAMRRSILSYGITESAIYPDLEGLAAEMRREFGFEV